MGILIIRKGKEHKKHKRSKSENRKKKKKTILIPITRRVRRCLPQNSMDDMVNEKRRLKRFGALKLGKALRGSYESERGGDEEGFEGFL